MSFEHLTNDQLARLFTTAVLIGMGILQILRPGCFWGMWMYFSGARAGFSPEQRERLARVLEARERAEGDTDTYTRIVGAFTIVMAPLGLISAVPYVLPYALSCLAMAAAILLSYLNFKRATERRIAPLVRRTAWASLPPLAIVATAVCVLGAGAFAAFPQYRAGAVVVIVSAIVLTAIAWRVAVAPALLLGDDPQLEYIVDEHLRFCRATSLISLACAPPTVLVALAAAALPPTEHYYSIVTLAVSAAFLVAMVLS